MCSKSLGPNWLSVLMSDSALAEPDRQSVLSQLFATTRAQFEAPEFGLELLLPDDAVALSDRTESLLAWCQGFLGGFGLADIQFELSEESSEALADMAKIAGTEVGLEDPDADELALTEILEFIRVVAMILYNECAQVHSNQQRLN